LTSIKMVETHARAAGAATDPTTAIAL